jgi:hypothetical protein
VNKPEYPQRSGRLTDDTLEVIWLLDRILDDHPEFPDAGEIARAKWILAVVHNRALAQEAK